MSALGTVFGACRAARRAAFIPYLTGGDPDLSTSADLIQALVDGGADVIEIGVPFSDPIADGPVNQRAAKRALDAGVTLSGLLDLVARHKSRSDVPVVLFSYFNPLFVRGLSAFAEQAASSGVDGVLCVDLPPDEAASEFIPALRQRDIDTVFLIAPTSTRDRTREIGKAASGFVYYVSRTGVTGVRSEIESSLKKEVRRVRRQLELPVAVGFGISTPEQVQSVGRFADGVVVGSALVRIVEQRQRDSDLPAALRREVETLAAPLHGRLR